MPSLPVISGKRLLKLLLKNNHIALRKKGSHVFIESVDGQYGTVVPIHANEDLGPGLLKAILNDLHIDVKDLVKLLRG